MLLCFFLTTYQVQADNRLVDIYPTAIFDFNEKSKSISGMGEKISMIIFAQLQMDANIALVDREELNKLEDEAVLNLSGMVNTQNAIQIGKLTGAKIIITGTIFEIDDDLMIVAKIIGTETSRVLGASVKGHINDNILELTESLSKKIAETIKSKSSTLVAKAISRDDRVAVLKDRISSAKKPKIVIDIKEQHINRRSINSAAETEMIFYSTESGFEVIEKDTKNANKANILIKGEGFTEFASRKGDIVGVKARLEVKVIDLTTNRVLAVDRQTELEVDLSELIAGKKALQKASAKIAERILPIIVEL